MMVYYKDGRKPILLLGFWLVDLGFNVPPTAIRSYGEETTVYSLFRQTGNARDQTCDP